MTLEGLAAAYLGQNRPDLAKQPLETAFLKNVRTRSLILNTAIYMLSGQRPPVALHQAADLVRQQLGHKADDEYAADIFGTLVNKIASMEKPPKEKVDAWWKVHDDYVDALARNPGAPAGKLKWGIDWLPAEDVKLYRLARGVTDPNVEVGLAEREVQLAAQRKRAADTALKNAKAAREKGEAADVQGAQTLLDAAAAAEIKAQKALTEAKAAVGMKPARWLTKFDPVVPQPIVIEKLPR